MKETLKIDNLTVAFGSGDEEQTAVRGVSLSIAPGETLALVGESGCGKTVLCKSILHLLCSRGKISSGAITLDGKDITNASEREMISYRGKDVAMVFQDPMTALDPAFSVGDQIAEVIEIHEKVTRNEAKARAVELMKLVKIDDAESGYHRKPYQFSGGMRQRIAIAAAVAAGPKLLLADEPTTALDEETQREILRLLKDVRKASNSAVLFITHDLSLVEEMAERVAVMKDGRIVETGRTEEVFRNPKHEYTVKLLGYLDYNKNKGHNHRLANKKGEAVLTVEGLCKSYKTGRKQRRNVLENFSMEIDRGETVGLVGKSGCGKSTLARCIMGIEKIDSGTVKLRQGAKMQMIFQDTGSSFNDRMTMEQIIGEPLVISGGFSRKEIHDRVMDAMKAVELDEAFAGRNPYRLSGGQRQRAAIARALITEPDIIIADEPLTGLDVTAQAQIVHLIKKLSVERNMSVLFIAHDIPMVNHVSDRIITM